MRKMRRKPWGRVCVRGASLPVDVKTAEPGSEGIIPPLRNYKGEFLQALSTVRGNQRVVSDNPEATYDTLNKYGYDLGNGPGIRSWTR